MTETIKKAAGYIRVSSPRQVREKDKKTDKWKEKISLEVQREKITEYAGRHELKLIKIYEDAGISGGTVKNRPGLQECLRDGFEGKFDVLVVYNLSRFGRNAREVLNNYHELKEADIDFISLKEGMDFSGGFGEAFLTISAAFAQLDNDIRRETMMDGRIAKQQQGKPTAGSWPIGRRWNDETDEWKLIDEIVEHIRWAANEYLNDPDLSLFYLAKRCKAERGWNVSTTTLSRTFRERCGNTWPEELPGEEPFVHIIPEILPEETITRLRNKIKDNRANTRTDVKKYPLSGFLMCEKCGKGVSGGSQTDKRNGKKYPYYYHQDARTTGCKAFSTLPQQILEKAVFETIFENFADVPAFEKAIKESLPDQDYRDKLDKKIKEKYIGIREIERKLRNIANHVAAGGSSQNMINTESELEESRDKLKEEWSELNEERDTLPDPQEVRQQAELIRHQLLEHYESKERIAEMTYDEKRNLLSWLFDGEDGYGIYVSVKGKNKMIDYFMYGRLVGIRTIKGDKIDYQDHLDDEPWESTVEWKPFKRDPSVEGDMDLGPDFLEFQKLPPDSPFRSSDRKPKYKTRNGGKHR